MTSMRTLNRRLLRWHRYAVRTCWHPRHTRPRGWGRDDVNPPGHIRAWRAREAKLRRRGGPPRVETVTGFSEEGLL